MSRKVTKNLLLISASLFILSFSAFSVQSFALPANSSLALFASVPRIPGGASSQMPSFTCSSSKPCPMGLADFGTNGKATYSYKAVTFESWANFTALTIGTSPIECLNSAATQCMSIQQNQVDYKMYEQGSASPIAGEYWVQDVPEVSQIGSTYYVNQLDNIWNFSAYPSGMGGTIYPNLLSKCSSSGGQPTYYYCQGNLKLTVSLPFEIQITTTTGVLSSGIHSGSSYVEFGIWAYQSGKLVGGGDYDEVAFKGTAVAHPYFYVNGKGTNPYGLYNDAETVLAGPGSSSTIKITSIKATISDSYKSSTASTFVELPHAWSAGYDTAETASGVAMSSTTKGTGIASTGVDNKKQLW
jgi:hypothetical protein